MEELVESKSTDPGWGVDRVVEVIGWGWGGGSKPNRLTGGEQRI